MPNENSLINYQTYEVPEDISELLALRRLKIGLSQRTLAGLSGVSLATIYRIENRIIFPRPSTALRLEETLAREEYKHELLINYYRGLGIVN